MGHITWPCPLQGKFVNSGLGRATINLHIKFEVSMFTNDKDKKAMQSVETGVDGLTQSHW